MILNILHNNSILQVLLATTLLWLSTPLSLCYADSSNSIDIDDPPQKNQLDTDTVDTDTDTDTLTSDLIDWLRANGAYINDKLRVKHVIPGDVSSPRGVFATEAMEEGEIVCSIPYPLMITPTDASVEDILRDPYPSRCGIIDAVMKAMQGTAKKGDDTIGDNSDRDGDNVDDTITTTRPTRPLVTPYARYLLAQPKSYLPAFWSDEANTLLGTMLRSTRTHNLTEYDALPPHGVEDDVDVLATQCDEDITDPLFLHAAMIVIARADGHFLTPYFDMINHSNTKHNVRHQYDPYKPEPPHQTIDQTGYGVLTTQPIPAGNELVYPYNKCNICHATTDWLGTPEIFLYFGFVETLPQRWLFDFARIKFDLVWKKKKMKNGDDDEDNKATTTATEDDADEGVLEVIFLVPPSHKGIRLLQEERTRLDTFSAMHRGTSSNTDVDDDAFHNGTTMSSYEWESLWHYYDALYRALSSAITATTVVPNDDGDGDNDDDTLHVLSDDVWTLDDNWWVQDGSVTAADSTEHYVLPTTTTTTTTTQSEQKIPNTDEL